MNISIGQSGGMLFGAQTRHHQIFGPTGLKGSAQILAECTWREAPYLLCSCEECIFAQLISRRSWNMVSTLRGWTVRFVEVMLLHAWDSSKFCSPREEKLSPNQAGDWHLTDCVRRNVKPLEFVLSFFGRGKIYFNKFLRSCLQFLLRRLDCLFVWSGSEVSFCHCIFCWPTKITECSHFPRCVIFATIMIGPSVDITESLRFISKTVRGCLMGRMMKPCFL